MSSPFPFIFTFCCFHHDHRCCYRYHCHSHQNCCVLAVAFDTYVCNRSYNYKYTCLSTIIMQLTCMYKIMQIIFRFLYFLYKLHNDSHSHQPHSKSNLCLTNNDPCDHAVSLYCWLIKIHEHFGWPCKN